MGIYKDWILKKEIEGYQVHARIKDIHDFDWGLKYLGIKNSQEDPYQAVMNYVNKQISDPYPFFTPEELALDQYRLKNNFLSFPSPITTLVESNNTVICRYFPTKSKKKIVIVIQHWNADVDKYDRLCKKLHAIGVPSIRFTLPYHGERSGGKKERSTEFVSANIGLTIQSMQQAVQEVRLLTAWLKMQNYSKIYVLGASIGSCVGFLAAAHEKRIDGIFTNLMSSSYGKVVWTGFSTQHIRKSLEGHITQEQLHSMWLTNSPIAFVDSIKKYNPQLRIFIITAKYDTTFIGALSDEIINALKEKGISFGHRQLPCGHYSLGKYWFKLIDAYYILRFIK